MKILKQIISVLTPLTLLLLASSSASADIFLMKNGTSVNGSIIRETHDSYLLRAEVSNNVYAEKTLLKSKIAEITKIDPSIAAFEEINSILPTPDLMTAKEYELLVRLKVDPFMKKYPSSPYFKDAEKILSTLKKEYHIIKSGGIKLNRKLLTPRQIEADKYNVQASVIEHSFMKYLKKKQYRAALSTFERLEDNYFGTNQCRRAQKAALIILPRYEEKLHKLLENVDVLMEKRKRALDNMSSGDSSRTKKIFAYEERKYQNLLNLATTNGKRNKWLPINQYFKKPIQNNINMVEIEIKRINTDSQKPTMDIGKFYRDTYRALDGGDYMLAKVSFDKFKSANPPQELVNELEPRLLDAKSVMEDLAIQQMEDERLAKIKADEERARLAKEAREAIARQNKDKEGKDLGNKVRDKLNINKKQETIDKLSE